MKELHRWIRIILLLLLLAGLMTTFSSCGGALAAGDFLGSDDSDGEGDDNSNDGGDDDDGISGNTGGSTGGNTGGGTGGSTGGTTGGGTGGSASYFDAAGNTSAFGIPAGMSGRVSTGQSVYSSRCDGCHGSMSAMNYSSLQSWMGRPPMQGLGLDQQEVIDLVAYLNRNAVPPGSGTGGTGGSGGTGGTGGTGGSGGAGGSGGSAGGSGGTDTGGASSAGQLVFESKCSGCHASLGALSSAQLNSALAKSPMTGLGLSETDKADLLAYLNNAGNGGGSDMDPGQNVFNNKCSMCHSSMGAISSLELNEGLNTSEMSGVSLSSQERSDLLAWLASGGGGVGGVDDEDDGEDEDEDEDEDEEEDEDEADDDDEDEGGEGDDD